MRRRWPRCFRTPPGDAAAADLLIGRGGARAWDKCDPIYERPCLVAARPISNLLSLRRVERSDAETVRCSS